MQSKAKSSLILAGLLASTAAMAQTKAPEPDYTWSFNAGVVTDYRYRGISQTRLNPALQGGIDFAHKSGFYAGTWLSTIQWIKDSSDVLPKSNISGSVEMDIYGGYKGTISDGVSYDVGYLRYEYVGNSLQDTGGGGVYKNANTDELYVALTMGPVTAKYSHALSNLFGYYDFANNRNTKGSGYFDLSATFDLGNGWSVVPHVGHQTVKNVGIASYMDYSVTLNKDIGGGISFSAMLVGTDADKGNYASPVNGKFMGKEGLVLGAKYSF